VEFDVESIEGLVRDEEEEDNRCKVQHLWEFSRPGQVKCGGLASEFQRQM